MSTNKPGSEATGGHGGWTRSDEPLVTVICACLNSTATLAEQLDALAAQEAGFFWEMIVVDDGSTDGTQNLARSYDGRFPLLHVLETDEPRSQAEGLNAAIAEARGRYVLVVDSDDVVAPGYLTAMVDALQNHPVVGARFDYTSLNEPWSRVRGFMQTDGLDVYDGFLPFIICAGVGIHRRCLEMIGGFDPVSTPVIDVDLSWRLQLAGVPLAFTPDAVLHYRYRTGLRATYRQKRNLARGQIALHQRFRNQGAPQRHLAWAAWSWRHALRAGVRVRSRSTALRFADDFGSAVGRSLGCIDAVRRPVPAWFPPAATPARG